VPVTAVVALEPGGWADLHGTPADPPGGALLAVAGVARPEAFAAQVRAAAGTPVELVGFPDHHAFTRDEAVALRRRAGDRTLVVTEKDAVKLEGLEPLLGPVRVLLQAIRWEAGEGAVRALITERAGGGD
ncbi:MAG TPA: tetraacyldisaccharide 4'-kinase, partial [Longimicrobiales bacterium]|nr:tetraacyldisaccharide 4'-kinase [Longimicrobiales bacterium]